MIREKEIRTVLQEHRVDFIQEVCIHTKKAFMAQNEWKKQDVFLEFEGIYGIARVWINGSLAAVNRNGYMGFRLT